MSSCLARWDSALQVCGLGRQDICLHKTNSEKKALLSYTAIKITTNFCLLRFTDWKLYKIVQIGLNTTC